MAEVKLFRPTEIEDAQWAWLHGVARQACEAAFREEVNVDAYIGQFNEFHPSHLNPNVEVGHRYNANQLYVWPKVAVAFEAGEPIGWAYAAHNVSGGGPAEGPHDTSARAELTRRAKLFTTSNYFWLREVYTNPKARRHGVAEDTLRPLMHRALPWQPVATYIYPGIYKPGQVPLESKLVKDFGMHKTGETEVAIEGLGKTMMIRLQADKPRPIRQALSLRKYRNG